MRLKSKLCLAGLGATLNLAQRSLQFICVCLVVLSQHCHFVYDIEGCWCHWLWLLEWLPWVPPSPWQSLPGFCKLMAQRSLQFICVCLVVLSQHCHFVYDIEGCWCHWLWLLEWLPWVPPSPWQSLPGFCKLKAQAHKYQAYLLLMSLMSILLNPELFILLKFLCNKKDKTGLPSENPLQP